MEDLRVKYHICGLLISVAVMLAGLALAGCSGIDAPVSIEPSLEILPATDINRTEASVSVLVKRGSVNLTYFNFHYGEVNKEDLTESVSDPESLIQTLDLKGLTAGKTYYCYAEAGTPTASFRTATINFSTLPNELPQVSSIKMLSTGPVGVMFEFEITSDGGEPVTYAGCELKTVNTGHVVRHTLNSEKLGAGTYRMSITGLAVSTEYEFTPFAANSIGEAFGIPVKYTTGRSILLTESGSLPFVLSNGTGELTELTIAGKMNGTDFKFLRSVFGAPGSDQITSKVERVDLTDVEICEGGEPFDGSRFTVKDELSTGLFADCRRLHEIVLPFTSTRMCRDAFANCTALESLTVSASISALLPSVGCTALKTLEVSPANQNYASVDGVLFNREVTEILWFPLGKPGAYILPETVTAIGEEAFAGTSITGLVIPSSVISISRGAFAKSSLREISLPDNLTHVSEGMFQNCENLQLVRLGTGTEFIGNYVFDGTSLQNLYVGATIPPFVSADAFVNKPSDITETCILHVPAGCKKYYRYHSRWGEFNKIEEF